MNGIKKVLVMLVVALGILAGMPGAWAQNSFTVPSIFVKQGDPGTVGDITSLAAATWATAGFDLGPMWQQYSHVVCSIQGGTSTAANFSIFFGDSLGTYPYRGITLGGGQSYGTANLATSGSATTSAFIFTRYVTLRISNADATNAISGGTWMCGARK